ncbi:MAG: HAD family phosphatase [Patescibacteria group bacterium]
MKNKVAIFDVDGTIFRKNLHFVLINELVFMGVFPKKVKNILVDIYADWLEHEGTYEKYRMALVDLYAEHIKGVDREDILKASKEVIRFHEKRTYIFAEKLIQRLKKENYRIIAISGSPMEIVEEYNRKHLKFDKVFGSVYELDSGGIYTGKNLFEPTKNKGEVAKQYAFENKISFKDSYGMGDTESDVSFLKMVENPIVFNPNQNLKEIAEENKWKIVVEKKDVIYEIS